MIRALTFGLAAVLDRQLADALGNEAVTARAVDLTDAPRGADLASLVLEVPVEGRECGDCSLCCKTQRIDELVPPKPSAQWCPHARPGKGGCSIYAQRPGECRDFRCSWLAGRLPDNLRPTKVKAVIGGSRNEDAILVYVDPGTPSAPDREPLKTWIDQVARVVPVIITCDDRRRLVYSGPKREINIRDPKTGEVWLSLDKRTAKVEAGI